jgi:YkoY family integral membrane protein
MQSGLIIANLVLIETLLSVDNAAVLATIVKDLGEKEKKRALSLGITGAVVFRIIALFMASFLIKFWFLKVLGGLYLIYLFYSWSQERHHDEHTEYVEKEKGIEAYFKKMLSPFWYTILIIGFVDITFSIDNVFAAVAYTKNLLLVILGVLVGILTMRFLAQRFVVLLDKYPGLEASAFYVILILGIKLALSAVEHFFPESMFARITTNHYFDFSISVLTILMFVYPILTHRRKNKA